MEYKIYVSQFHDGRKRYENYFNATLAASNRAEAIAKALEIRHAMLTIGNFKVEMIEWPHHVGNQVTLPEKTNA